MSHETASSSSSRSRPALPPFLHLTGSQEKNDSSNYPGGPKPTKKSFGRAFHHVFPRRFSTVDRLEKVAEATVEDENVDFSTRRSSSVKPKPREPPHLRSSATSIISQSGTSHIATPPRPPTMLITPFPSLNVSDIPCRSPTNKSPFSAVLLAREDEEYEEDDPELAHWYTEQLHRARLTKLTRHLGEEIPVEMVLSPASLPHGVSRSSIPLRRGSYHRKRRSLDPSAFRQDSSITGSAEGILRRSKSLKGHDVIHPTLSESVTGTIPEAPIIECTASGVHNVETAVRQEFEITDSVARSLTSSTQSNMEPIPDPTPENHSNFPMNISHGDVSHERTSIDTHSDTLLSSRPSVETSSETCPFSHRASHVPLARSRTLPRRPATADACRRVEKLADFFGVEHEEISAVAQARGITQRHQLPSTSAAGDLAIGSHAPNSQLEVEVKVSKPTRFWNGRAMTKSVHPDDVMAKLRTMRAS